MSLKWINEKGKAKMTEIKLKGSPKAVSELAKKIVKVCKTTKCKHRRGKSKRFVEMSVFIKLNVYGVQALRKINSKKVEIKIQ